MNKLIKLSNQHYVIVDDSEIKEGDYFLYDNKEVKYKSNGTEYHGGNLCHISGNRRYDVAKSQKITHSFGKDLKGVINHSISEVEELVNGYSVDKMVKIWSNDRVANGNDKTIALYENGFIDGFNAHKELIKDKLFTVEDAQKIVEFGFRQGYSERQRELGEITRDEYCKEGTSGEFIQLLLPKTEWDVEFDTQGKIVLL